MKRRFFSVLAGISLLLCGASVACWIRSYWAIDKIQIGIADCPAAAIYKGGVYLQAPAPLPGPFFQSQKIRPDLRFVFDQPDYDWILFDWQRGPAWFFGVPLGLITIATAILPAARGVRFVVSKRKPAGISGAIEPGNPSVRVRWWKWGPWYPPPKPDASEYELALRGRLRFLLPRSLCILMMFGYLGMAADFIGPHRTEPKALVTFGVLEILLAANLVARRRCAKKLKRVLAGLCGQCGYDIRATPLRCPECGTVPSSGRKSPG